MGEKKVIVFCYWNGCVKYGLHGVYYEGSTSKKIIVKQKTEFSRLVDGLHLIAGLDKFKVFGRYPVAVSPNLFTYIHLPVLSDSSLETMLEVPSIHPSINSVELYVEVKPVSDDAINPAACSSPLDNLGGSSSRQRIQQPQEANGYDDTSVTVKLKRDNGVDNINEEANADFGNSSMRNKSLGSDGLAQAINLTADYKNAPKNLNVPALEMSANACLYKGVNSSASKPWFRSSLWVDDHELRIGLCFKDKDELKKAVDWCSIRGRQKCIVHETEKDEYAFECIRLKCNWSLRAARMEEHGLVEIIKCSGPHTCCPTPIRSYHFDVKFAAEEIECLIRVQPTLTVEELNNWWFEKYSYKLESLEMKSAKQEVIKKLYGDWDQSFRVLPKLMAAMQSSNGLVVDWQYDVFPNPEFASFRGMFWAFSQSIEGFPHCRPLIAVESKGTKGKYPMKLMIAMGLDADDYYFPLAFAITKELSTESWRWFLSGIREKVTQRKGLCLISSPHPDILAVINEPESLWQEPWACHRFCLDHICSQFHDIFQDVDLKNLVDKAGCTMQQDEFKSHMETIKKKNPEARRWLDQIPSHQWTLAHDGGRRYGTERINTTHMYSYCESFHQSLDLPLTVALLLLFDDMSTLFFENLGDSRSCRKFGYVYTSVVMDKLEEFMSASIAYDIMPLDKGVFQVTEPLQEEEWIVQLSESTCTCGKFQSGKIPCLHALAICQKLKINPLQYVDDCYTVERLDKTYAATFSPVPEVSAWPEASDVPALFPPVIQRKK